MRGGLRGRPPIAVLVALACVGCGSCDRQSERADEPKAEAPEPAGPDVGTLEGVVRLAEGTELPEYTREQLNEQPGTERPDVCPPPQKRDVRPVDLSEGRGLEGVFVSVTGFSESPPREPQQHEVVIRDCRLEPALVAGMRDDEMVVRNETDYPFLPRIGADPFMQALTKGQSRTIPLDRGGAYPLRCGVGAPCGRAELIVVYHPVYAVTGSEGRFRIDNVPAGEKVTVHAWHPLFTEAAVEAKAKQGESARVELTLEPGEDEGEGEADAGDENAPEAATDTGSPEQADP